MVFVSMLVPPNIAMDSYVSGIKLKLLVQTLTRDDLNRSLQHPDRPRWLSWMRCPTGDQEVAGSTPPRSATFFRGD